jgi:hypothetical protein
MKNIFSYLLLREGFPLGSRNNYVFTFCCSLFFILSVYGFTESLEDFRIAASYAKGPELIPFKELRVEAFATAREVDYCKPKVLGYDADKLCIEKNNLLKDKEVIIAGMDALEKEAKKYPNTTPDKRRMDKLIGELKTCDGKLAEKNKKIAEALEAFRRLFNARGALRHVFDEAQKRLEEAKTHPEKYLGKNPSSPDRGKLNQYIETIMTNIEKEEAEHKKQEDGAENKVEQLGDCLAAK